MSDEKRIKITDPHHLLRLGEALGSSQVLSVLDEVSAANRALPGFALAKALVDTAAANLRTELIVDNFKAISRAGVVLDAFSRVAVEGDEIIVSFKDLAELAQEP